MLEPTLSCPHNVNEGNNMSRFQKLTHVLWHCQYHMVWVPTYRYRVLKGRNGPGKLDMAISEISAGFQAAKSGEAWSKYTASGVRRSSALCRRRVL